VNRIFPQQELCYSVFVLVVLEHYLIWQLQVATSCHLAYHINTVPSTTCWHAWPSNAKSDKS